MISAALPFVAISLATPTGWQTELLTFILFSSFLFLSPPTKTPPAPPPRCVISSILPSNGNPASQQSSYATHSKMINIFSFWSGDRVKGEKCRLMKYDGITEGALRLLACKKRKKKKNRGGVGLLPSLHLSNLPSPT